MGRLLDVCEGPCTVDLYSCGVSFISLTYLLAIFLDLTLMPFRGSLLDGDCVERPVSYPGC